MSVETCHHTHCVVEWEDDKTEYAVVHTQRAKIVNGSSLKIGCAVLFVGNSRDRRRGKVLYIGMSMFENDVEREARELEFFH